MKLVIKPRVGIGPLCFGMHLSEVRKILGEDFVSRLQNEFATHPRDYYLKMGIFTDYDHLGRLEAIELAEPAEAVFDGMNLLKMTLSKARSFLRKNDPGIVVELGSIVSKRLGIAIWSPAGEEGDTDSVHTVLGFRDGYYENTPF